MADEGKDKSGQESDLRSGGNMETRNGVRVPAAPPSKDAGTRSGGNMQTRGASGGPASGQTTGQPAEGAGETPAGQRE